MASSKSFRFAAEISASEFLLHFLYRCQQKKTEHGSGGTWINHALLYLRECKKAI